MTPTLYITELSPFGARVRLVCNFTGISFTELTPPGGAGSDTMKAISPFGKMPTIVLEDQVLVESVALMEYVVDMAGGSHLMPASPQRRAAIRGLILAHDHYVLGAVRLLFLQLRTGKPDAATCRNAITAANDEYQVLTRLFDGTGFAIGGEVSLADLAMAPFALLFNKIFPRFGGTTPFTTQPRLIDWSNKVATVPEIANVFARMETAITNAFGTT